MLKIFQEEFKKQEQNILNILSGNLEYIMNEIKNLKQKVCELKSSLDFTFLRKKLKSCKKTCKAWRQSYEIFTSKRVEKWNMGDKDMVEMITKEEAFVFFT